MKTFRINLEKQYADISTKINSKGVEYSHHGFNEDTLITKDKKYVISFVNSTVSVYWFDYKNAVRVDEVYKMENKKLLRV